MTSFQRGILYPFPFRCEFRGISFSGRPAKKNRSRPPKREREKERRRENVHDTWQQQHNNSPTLLRLSFACVCVCCPHRALLLLLHISLPCAFFFCRIFANVFFSSSSSPHPADDRGTGDKKEREKCILENLTWGRERENWKI